MIQEEIFSIEYERGRMKIDLSAALPCPKTEFKRLLSAVDLSADSITYADELNDYIRQQYEAAKQREETETWQPNKKAAAQEAKKFAALNEMLVKKYDCAAVDAAQEEQPKMKKAIVYSFCAEYGKQTAKPYLNGYTFRLAGIDFSVYRRDNKDAWRVLCSDSGMQCATAEKKTDIIDEVKKLLPRIQEARKKEQYAEMKSRFISLMIEAGYMEAQQEGSSNDECAEAMNQQPHSTNEENDSTAAQETKPEAAQKTKPEQKTKQRRKRSAKKAQPEQQEAQEKKDLPEAVNFCGKMIDLEKLLRSFSDVYDYLYNNRDEHEHYREAVNAFDEHLSSMYADIVASFNEYRQDFISSDREAAAFVIALHSIAGSDIPKTDRDSRKEEAEREELIAAAFARYDLFTDDLKNKYKRGFITYDELEKELVEYHLNALQQEAEAAEKEDPGQPEAAEDPSEKNEAEQQTAEEDSKPDLPEGKDYSIIDSTIKDRIINAYMHSRITAEEMRSLLEEAYAAATAAEEKTITPQEAAGQPQSEKSTAHDMEAVCTVRIDCRAFYAPQEADSTAGQEKDPAAQYNSRTHNSSSRKPEYMDSS